MVEGYHVLRLKQVIQGAFLHFPKSKVSGSKKCEWTPCGKDLVETGSDYAFFEVGHALVCADHLSNV